MSAEIVVINDDALRELGRDIDRAKRAMIGRLAERGYRLLRDEIKRSAYQTGNLMQGVAPPDVDYDALEADLTVSARSGATLGGMAQVFNSKGQPTRTVSLRPSPAYNYAEAVARGRPAIAPKQARALLIPVPIAPTGEGYLLIGGQRYILRRSAKATKPNPFHTRAGDRLEKEAPQIGEAVLREIV